VKAAFLVNFAKFVEWPESSYLGQGAPFSICVLGEDPFGDALNDLRGKFVLNRPVAVWRIKNADDGWRCQILFVSASEKSHLPAIFKALRGARTLLVGETDGFAASGGDIQFMLEDDHVRFAINPDAIRRAGLQVSSKLLALAKIVRDERTGGKG
jgi:YfiR/HmsC-like